MWMAATAVLAGVALVQMGDSGVPAWRRLRAQDAQLGREVEELTTRNAELRKELQALKDDPETLERLAREKAGMRRPGEEVMVVLPAAEARAD
jgi:cell division protein FtsB